MRMLALLPLVLAATPALAQTHVVQGVVYDSLSRKPLANATVSVVDAEHSDRAYNARSDSAGRFMLRGVEDGTYLAGFFHPVLDSLGIQAPLRRVALAGEDASISVALAIPSARSIRDAICGVRTKTDSTGVFIGHVARVDGPATVDSARIVAQWSTYQFTDGRLSRSLPTLRATTGDNGWFAFCGLPPETDIRFIASLGADSSGVVVFQVPASGVAHHDLFIAKAETYTRAASDSSPADIFYRGSARLHGVVRDAASNKPLPGVQVTVAGTGLSATANDRGEFTLAQLPLGSQMLSARKLGYMLTEQVVDLLPNDTARVDFTLATTTSVLDTVKVLANRIYNKDANGFYRRQRMGIGHYFDAVQVARIRPFNTSDLLMRVPSVRINYSGIDKTVPMRSMTGGFCRPSLWIDGMPMHQMDIDDFDMMVHPDQIEGMEVYTSPGQAPPQLSEAFNGCGVIAVWTQAPMKLPGAKR